MTNLITTLGQKLAERWLATIVLPGLLYAAVVAWARLAGNGHPFDSGHVTQGVNTVLKELDSSKPAGAAVAIIAAFGVATAAGFLATFLAEHVVHPLWIARGPKWWLDRRRRVTKRSWESRTPAPPTRYLPQRATPIGETFRLIGERVDAQYGLSAVDIWPRVWLLTGTDTRELLNAAHRRYFSDAALAAWSLLYLPLTVLWWPAALLGLVGIALGYFKARQSGATLAALIESAIDINQRKLAESVGVDLPGNTVSPVEGNRINNVLNKRA